MRISMRIIASAVIILLLPTVVTAFGGKPGFEKPKNQIWEQLPTPKNEQAKEPRKGSKPQPSVEIRKQKEDREIAKEKKEKFKKSIQQRFKDYHNYRKLYQMLGLRNEEGFQYAKMSVIHGAYAIVDFLNIIKADIETLGIPNETKETALQRIDEVIRTLEEKIEKVNQSTTIEEFRSAVGDLNSYWRSVKNDVKIYAELVVIAKLDDLIDKAYTIGLDLSESQEIDREYFEYLDNARDSLENATAKISRGEDALDDIQRARENLRNALKILKGEAKPFFGNETGQLWAEINGTATVNGSAVIHIKGNATVKVSPSHAVITAVGFEKSDGVYSGSGNLVIKGENVTVNATGDFWMFVKGSAYIHLEGVGEYKVKPLPEEEMGEFVLKNNATIVIGGEQL